MNTELARKVLARYEKFPEQFHMGSWGRKNECGTTACLAGHALIEAGWELRSGLRAWSSFFAKDGEEVAGDDVGDLARHLLGLSDDEFIRYDDYGHRELFDACLDEDEAIAWLREITEAAERAEVP